MMESGKNKHVHYIHVEIFFSPSDHVNIVVNNRLSCLLEQLEKAWQPKKSGRPEEKELEQARYITNKIQQLLSSQEKCRKELLTKQPSGIILLLRTLEAVSIWDMQATLNLVSCFNELLTSGKRIGILNDYELPEFLFQTLSAISSRTVSKESSLLDDVIVLLHGVLSKIGTKEKRFIVQARMTGALETSLNIAKQNPQNFKVLHPVLQVLKIYTNSSVNCNLMIKHGTIETMLKILPFCGQKRISSAKLILEILAALAKSKLGAKKAVMHGAVPLLLNAFIDWHRSDHRHRQIALRKSILTVLKLIIMLHSGRKAFANVDGPRVLYTIGLEGLEYKELDGVVKLIILILRRCFAMHRLPINGATSIFAHDNRSSTQLNRDTQNSEDEGTDATNSEDDAITTTDDSDDIGFRASYDDDDDDDDRKCELRDNPSNRLINNTAVREDLQQYKLFVKELLEYEVDMVTTDSLSCERQQDCPIKIPTATMEFLEETCNRDENLPNSKDNEQHCFPFIKKSSSFDYNSLQCSKTTGVMSKSLSVDTENEADITTVQPIIRPQQQGSVCNHRKNKIPSMPCFPVIKTNNSNSSSDAVEFLVQGVKLQKNVNKEAMASSAKIAAMRTTSVADDQMQEQDFDDNDSISLLDREQSASALGVEADDIKHILPFVKRASPDIYGHYPMMENEPILEKKPVLNKQMIFQDFSRFLNSENVINRVVYELDNLVDNRSNDASLKETLINELIVSPKKSKWSQNKFSGSSSNISDDFLKTSTLQFESRFESGNLRKAIQIRQYEYDLILNPDINADRHCQWFYFEVTNMECDIPYRFNIINCEKFNSQFNFGMQPVMYSTKDAKNGHAGWERIGSNICYYKNYYQRRTHTIAANRYYYTTTFTIRFPHQNDVCYLAYHYPFSYTMLKEYLSRIESRIHPNIYYQRQKLCDTSQGNKCDILTITERPNKDDHQSIIDFRKRPYIILTSRVHPGETCASWVMKGVIDFLTNSSEDARKLRGVYIFKIIPFLNPDGVINGNHRCCTSGEDLNRNWISPDPFRHPTIYHTKGLIQYLNTINKTPLVFCDFHGHSRKKNVFMYGCSVSATTAARLQGNSDTLKFSPTTASEEDDLDPEDSSNGVNSSSEEDTNCKTLPRILNAVAAAFSIQSCSFVMEKSKEATARVVVYKDLGVTRSYTVESTYCGADQGPYKGNQFGTRELEEMGKCFCVGLQKLSLSYSIKLHPEYFSQPFSCEGESSSSKQSAISLSEMKECEEIPSMANVFSVLSSEMPENMN